jgi:predicted ribosome quality control (RQC) complex YloA/Tae2 family protein
MDRFFLRALVRELAPQLLGRRVRGIKRWADGGFVILLGARRGTDIIVSLSPHAPGLYVGRPPASADDSSQHSRLKKLLTGSELVGIEAARLDRVVTLTWKLAKPSGATRTMELVLEWPGTRTAAVLVDSATSEVLDVVSPGTPRTVPGEVFRALPPSAGSREVAANREEFQERLRESRGETSTETQIVRAASGLSPQLVEEVVALASGSRISTEEAFEQVVARLGEPPRPVLLRPVTQAFHQKGYRLIISAIPLSPRDNWGSRSFATCNEAAEAFIAASGRLDAARGVYIEAFGKLRTQLKKTRKLHARLKGELDGLRQPDELRRWGEILLAGLQQARRIDDEVMVPDPYQEGAPSVRVPIDPRLDLTGNAQRYFKSARKAVRSRERLEARLAKTSDELDHLETLDLAFEDLVDVETLAALVEELRETGILSAPRPRGAGSSAKVKKKESGQPLEPRRFRLSSGAVALAGRSARSNEELTFRIAQPEDLWFHAASNPGAHVVLRVPSGVEASGEDIEETAAVAAFFSKARGATSAEILYTPRKNIRKIPGAPPGTVRATRFRTVRVRPALPPAPTKDACREEGDR